MDRSTAPVLDPSGGSAGSHDYLCRHAAKNCGSSGFWATSAGREKTNINCELCHDTHRGTLHARLVDFAAWRPIFFQELVRTWGPWADIARQWLTIASLDNINHIS